jgi:hypothetical protein
MLGPPFAPVEPAHRPSKGMSRPTDQELSPTAAQRMLRSIAHLDRTKLDQGAGPATRQPFLIEAPGQFDVLDVLDVLDVIGEEDEQAPSQARPWPTSGGGWWYLNEVPEGLIDDSEMKPWRADRLLNLAEEPEVGAA